MGQYVRMVIKEMPLELPSHDFTAKVMANILAIEKSKATVYKPLISKTGWILIFGGIITAIGYFILNGGTPVESQAWSFGHRAKDFIKTFGDVHLFQFSHTTINVIVVSTILILLQIALLKNYLDKRVAK